MKPSTNTLIILILIIIRTPPIIVPASTTIIIPPSTTIPTSSTFISPRAVLSNLVTSIDPIAVYVYGCTEGVDIRLKVLAAYFAFEGSDAGFSIDLTENAILVIAEKTGELCGETFAFLWAGGLAGSLLAFSLSTPACVSSKVSVFFLHRLECGVGLTLWGFGAAD